MTAQEGPQERPPLGAALTSAREAAGLTTLQVAQAINLRETVVRAIEADDFSLCGGDVYAKGHLRAYARYVGLDVEPLLEAFAVRRQQERGTRATGPGQQRGSEPRSGSSTARLRPLVSGEVPLERPAPNWSLLAGVALVVLVVFLGVQLVGELRGPGRPSQEVAAPVTASQTPASTRSAPTTAPPATNGSTPTTGASPSAPGGSTGMPPASGPSTPAVPVDGVVLALRATGDSWVTVKGNSGRTVFAGLLGKGDRKRFTDADSLRVTLGNAGGVQLTVNGKRVGSAGRDGEVKRLTIRPGDPA